MIDKYADIEAVLADIRTQGTQGQWNPTFNRAATASALEHCESVLHFRLPDDLRHILSITNGIHLETPTKYYGHRSNIYLLATDKILMHTKLISDFVDQAVRSKSCVELHPYRFIAFGDQLDGDLCCFDLDRPSGDNPFTIIPIDHEQPRTWPDEPAIASSVTDWLTRVVDIAHKGEFLPYWNPPPTEDSFIF